jgi:hypothetical protein
MWVEARGGGAGPPEDVARVKESYAGQFLKELLRRRAKGKGGRCQEAGGGVSSSHSYSARMRITARAAT